jgi:hypothetical protein
MISEQQGTDSIYIYLIYKYFRFLNAIYNKLDSWVCHKRAHQAWRLIG